MTYSDKSKYEGEWKMDLRHGRGDYEHKAKGISYSGQWECNLPHGEGVLRIKSKTEDYEYKGEPRSVRLPMLSSCHVFLVAFVPLQVSG